MLTEIKTPAKASQICVLAKLENKDNCVKKNAPINVALYEQFVIVQNETGKAVISGNGKTVNKKHIPYLIQPLLFGAVKNTEVYWYKKVLNKFTTVKVSTVDKAGNKVYVSYAGKFSLEISDSRAWYDSFIRSPGLKSEIYGAIYTEEGLVKVFQRFAEKSIEYAFKYVEPRSEEQRAKMEWPGSYEVNDYMEKWPNSHSYDEARAIYAKMKEYLSTEFAKYGFTCKLSF